ncbi:hypothetical protein FJZ22_02660 [Candidatus Pacearchaeota archaeon]|nr:hypothetical protein [Candidatus Pacearchaeota archaeon]
MNLNVCSQHTKKKYTLKSLCPNCKKPTISAHYKYKNLTAPKHETAFPGK